MIFCEKMVSVLSLNECSENLAYYVLPLGCLESVEALVQNCQIAFPVYCINKRTLISRFLFCAQIDSFHMRMFWLIIIIITHIF